MLSSASSLAQLDRHVQLSVREVGDLHGCRVVASICGVRCVCFQRQTVNTVKVHPHPKLILGWGCQEGGVLVAVQSLLRVAPSTSREGSEAWLCTVEGRWDSLGLRCPTVDTLQPPCFVLEFAAERKTLSCLL